MGDWDRTARRRQIGSADLARAQKIVDLAWDDLSDPNRALLRSVRADQRKVVDRPWETRWLTFSCRLEGTLPLTDNALLTIKRLAFGCQI